MTILPTFSLRQVMVWMIGVAIAMACLASAYRGSFIGLCLIAGLISTILPLLSMGLIYWVALGLRKVVDRFRIPFGLTPIFIYSALCFSSTSYAQQLIPAGKQGYHVTIDDSYQASGFGFFTIRLKLEKFPATSAKADEPLTAVVHSLHYGFGSGRVVVPMVIEAGETSTSVEIYVPELSTQSRHHQIAIRRGHGDGGSGSTREQFSTIIYNSSAPGEATKIWINSAAEKDRGVTYGFWSGNFSSNARQNNPNLDQMSPFSSAGFAATSKNVGSSAMMVSSPCPIHPEEVPKSWVGISSTEMIFITFDELKSQSDKNPGLCRVLENWVAAGGSLIVFDLAGNWNPTGGVALKSEESWKKADQILPVLLGVRRMEEIRELVVKWQQPSENFLQVVVPIVFRSDFERGNIDRTCLTQQREMVVFDNSRDSWLPCDLSEAETSAPPFLVCPHVKGRVIAVKDHFQNWTAADWQKLSNGVVMSGGSQAKLLTNAEGVQHFSIAGIGEPPLRSFQVLMSLFVLIAGPGVYLVLNRSRQMQLFFVVVPVLSLTTCFALLGYVVLVEGFDSYGRTQSVTWVDHPRQSAVTRTRSTYYHGIRPSSYRHTSQIAPMGGTSNNINELVLRQEGGVTDVYGGNIQPRLPHEMVNVFSGEMNKFVRYFPPAVNESEEGSDGRILNQLGAKVITVVYRAEDGWFYGSDIEDQQSVPAKSIDEKTASQMLSDLVSYLCPVDSRFVSRSRDMQTDVELSVVENIRNRVDLKSLIRPGSYIAVLSDFPEIEPQLQKVNFKNRLHLVIGRW